jgi:hypothetical protein
MAVNEDGFTGTAVVPSTPITKDHHELTELLLRQPANRFPQGPRPTAGMLEYSGMLKGETVQGLSPS